MKHASPSAILIVVLAAVLSAQSSRPVPRAVASGSRASSPLPPILLTAAPVYDSLAALRGGERFPQGAQLMILRDGRLQSLVPDFAASADAGVSFDAKTILFSGKQRPSDPWQIWSVSADGGVPQRVQTADADLIRPLWMPGNRVVYARHTASGFALESAQLDGSAIQKLSFVPGNFIPDDVLRDGRILFGSGFPLGSGNTPELYLVYADGSGVESVRCDHEAAQQAGGREHGRQMLSGDIVFTHGSHLARFTSPLANEAPIAAPAGNYAGDLAELPDGRWLLSWKKSGAEHFQLAAWTVAALRTQTLAEDRKLDLVEPAVITARPVPKRHPSALHPWTTGNLLALNSRLSRSGPLVATPALVRAETLGADGQTVVLGTAPVESDGSFFVQATGDRPLRFVVLDAQGKTLRAESGWFWVRSGEQRICVGCHTGPERAPDNRVPQVLLRTTTPLDLTAAPKPASAAGGR